MNPFGLICVTVIGPCSFDAEKLKTPQSFLKRFASFIISFQCFKKKNSLQKTAEQDFDVLKLQDITCEGTQAELHQIPASLWQMPEWGEAAALAAAAVWMAKKNFWSIWISRQYPPRYLRPSGSEWHWQSPTAGKETGGWNR